LQNKTVEIEGYGDKEEADMEIQKHLNNFTQEDFNKKNQ
jgi:hypothetical protein